MAATYRVVVDEPGIARMFRTGGQASRWNKRQAETVEARAKVMVPKRSRALYRSHRVEQDRSSLGRFSSGFSVTAGGPSAPHAPWVHDGTYGPIRPRTKRALRLPAGGGYPKIIRKWVNGQDAQPWLANAGYSIL